MFFYLIKIVYLEEEKWCHCYTRKNSLRSAFDYITNMEKFENEKRRI